MVRYLFNDADQIFQHVSPALVGDDSGCEVAEHMGACGLDSVEVGRLEEEVDNAVASLLVVEEHKQTPVDEP